MGLEVLLHLNYHTLSFKPMNVVGKAGKIVILDFPRMNVHP
jgi:hypothetical protein